MQSGMLEGAGSSATAPGALGHAVKQTRLSPFIWKQNETIITELCCDTHGDLQMRSTNQACSLSPWVTSTMRRIKDGTLRPSFFSWHVFDVCKTLNLCINFNVINCCQA